MNPSASTKLQRARAALEKRLAPLRGFVGTGVTSLPSGEPAILVLVTTSRSPADKECAALTAGAEAVDAPRTWHGVPVLTEAVGAPRRQNLSRSKGR
jgi:hypothetical protein